MGQDDDLRPVLFELFTARRDILDAAHLTARLGEGGAKLPAGPGVVVQKEDFHGSATGDSNTPARKTKCRAS